MSSIQKRMERLGVGRRLSEARVSEADFWKLVDKIGWGKKTTDYKAAMKSILLQYTPEDVAGIENIFRSKKVELDRIVSAWELKTGQEIGVGDDSYDDLLSHIIGLGRREFEAVKKNPELAKKRADKGDYKESFAYAIPSERDFESLNVTTYQNHAKMTADNYEEYLRRMEQFLANNVVKDMKWLIGLLKQFSAKGDIHALKKEKAQAVKVAEKYDVLHTKWGVINLFSDLDDFMEA